MFNIKNNHEIIFLKKISGEDCFGVEMPLKRRPITLKLVLMTILAQ